MFAQGLLDSKVAAMQFFEGFLYVLFDNARLIRAFDLQSGDIVHQIPLPVAALGSEKQWEGMQLERRIKTGAKNDETGTGLRGPTNAPAEADRSTLLLYLALDTPPQIWTIALNEKPSSGQGVNQLWTFPDCAL